MDKRKFFIFYALSAVCAITGFVMKEDKAIFFTCVFLVVFLLVLAAFTLKRKKASSSSNDREAPPDSRM
jgi:uncharacterized membrane protein YfcA